MVANSTLAKVCVYGGVGRIDIFQRHDNLFLNTISMFIGVITAAMLMKSSIEGKIREADYYKQAMKTLRAHNGARQLLGEPIRELGVDLQDKDNQVDGYKAHFKVTVKGPKERGTMLFWAQRPDVKQSWDVQRIELELKSDPNKRLLVKKEDQ